MMCLVLNNDIAEEKDSRQNRSEFERDVFIIHIPERYPCAVYFILNFYFQICIMQIHYINLLSKCIIPSNNPYINYSVEIQLHIKSNSDVLTLNTPFLTS